MDTCISAIKKQCIAALMKAITQDAIVNDQVLKIQPTSNNVVEMSNPSSKYSENDFEPLMAAEPFECYKWEGFDQSICDFFGGDKTILIGCYKGKKYKDWIHTHNIYTIRLGDTKGSMEANLPRLESLLELSVIKKKPVFVSLLREEMVSNYPYTAIRELLLNACMHRDL